MKKSKKLKVKVGIFLLTLFFLLLLFCYVLNRIEPIVSTKALAISRTRGTRVINEAVEDVLREEEVSYLDIITTTRDKDGNVMSLSANMVKVNTIKSKVSLKIASLIKGEYKSFGIPLGNLSGTYLLSGRGPKINVKLLLADSVTTTLESTVEEMGINQSRHKIEMIINLKMAVILLRKQKSVDISDRVLIADTIIVGKVPDAYTSINRLTEEEEGDVFDFMAQTE